MSGARLEPGRVESGKGGTETCKDTLNRVIGDSAAEVSGSRHFKSARRHPAGKAGFRADFPVRGFLFGVSFADVRGMARVFGL